MYVLDKIKKIWAQFLSEMNWWHLKNDANSDCACMQQDLNNKIKNIFINSA